MPRVFVCTGEVSGDLQASHLIRTLLRLRPELEVVAVGGDRMAAAGAQLLHNTTGISSVGILEALPFIGPTLWLEWKVSRYLHRNPPDLAILVDYVGVNHRMGDRLQKLGVPVVYYIAPQEWVWTFTPKLTHRLVAFSRLILAIFSAEAEYYAQAGGNVRWVGHPLIDILQSPPSRAEARARLEMAPDARAIAIFPASRPQELRTVLPTLLQAAQLLQAKLPDVEFWVSLSRPEFRRTIAKQAKKLGVEIKFVERDTPTVLSAVDLVLAKSGTVNLETAIRGLPQVVIYRVNPITYWIAKYILKFSVPFVSPPNLVLMRPIVMELLQHAAQPETIATEAIELLSDPRRRKTLQQDYAQLRAALGQTGVLERAASEILGLLDRGASGSLQTRRG
ncbi:lipid-A-disaccharide synthase [Synechococcus sp. PCC 7336]|uniref:lipid-A-disaccharide synthase n=1 Tax=Synechococcus sp. PCC 7336 TaxID=195250 RepID=UPI000348ED0F|nr:lipid-A-disaccharide synthase [Synechococcus sp. PCC 7336]